MAFRAVGGNKSATTSVAVTIPSGIEAGDILIAYCSAYRSTSAAPGNPTIANTGSAVSAWGTVVVQTTGTYYKSAYATKIAAADADGGSVTAYTWSSSSAVDMTAHVIVLSGRAQAAPTPISNTAYITSDTNIQAAALTATALADLVWVGYNYRSTVQAVVAPSGWTDGGVQTAAAAIASDIAYKQAVSAGSTGVVNGTMANAVTTKHAFMFNVPIQIQPTVTAISPTTGPTAGGVGVKITGTGFMQATGVKFGSVAATEVVVISDASITCLAPAGSAGTVDVEVTNPAGTSSAVGADQFTYGTGTVVYSGLVLQYVGADAKSGTAPGNNTDPTSTWYDLKATYPGALNNFGWTTSSGWAGSGTAIDPYRLVFDGTDDEVDLASWPGSVFTGLVWTLEAWVAAPYNNAKQIGIFWASSASYANGVDLRYDDGTLAVRAITSGGTTDIGASVANDGNMHHVVGTCDGSNLRLYVNGALVNGPTAVSGTLAAPTSCGLGADGGWLDYGAINVATMRVYNAALSAANVTQNYQAGPLGVGVAPGGSMSGPVLGSRIVGGSPIVGRGWVPQ